MLPVLVLNLAAAVVVTPSAGSLGFTGNTPTVTTAVVAAPSVGALEFAGGTPTALISSDVVIVILPSDGPSISLLGLTPSVRFDYVSAPSVGALTLAGGTSNVNTGVNIPVDAGSLTLAGDELTTKFDYVARPSVVGLTLSGQTPTAIVTAGCRSYGPLIIFGLNLDPNVGGNLTFVIPSSLALSLSGGTPVSLRSGDEDLPSDFLTSDEATFKDSTGYKNAGVTQPVVFPTTASLSLSGGTPTVTNSLTALPTSGFLALTGRTSALSTAYGVTVGALTLTGNTPTILVATPTVTPGAGSLTLAGGAPNASRGYYNTYGTLISGRAFVVKYADQYGSGSLITLPASLRLSVNRGSQGEGTLVSGSARINAQTWEIVQGVEETWICQDGGTETWTTVTDTTEAWTNV